MYTLCHIAAFAADAQCESVVLVPVPAMIQTLFLFFAFSLFVFSA